MPIYFNLNNQLLPINMESIGNQWPQLSLQRIQGYPRYHWLQTETGMGEIWIEHHKFLLKEGEGILIAPFVPHAYYPVSDNWLTNFVTFDGHLKNNFQEMLSNQNFILATNTDHYTFSATIQEMILAFEDEKEHLTLSVLCYEFLLHLGQSQEPIENHELFKRIVEPGIQEIQTNYSKNLTVESIAESLFISPQYFSRLFKKFTGQTPYQYLLDLRIRRAKELLINQPDLPVHLVATKVGFESTSQFIEIFRKRTTYTPKKFRNLY